MILIIMFLEMNAVNRCQKVENIANNAGNISFEAQPETSFFISFHTG